MEMRTVKNAAATAVLLALGSMGLPAQAQEVYVQGGTQGGGLGASWGITRYFGVHADVNGYNLSHSFNAGGNKFDGKLQVRHLGVFADVFPFPSYGFRVTAGTLINRDRMNATAVPTNGNYYVRGVAIPAALAQGQQLSVNARFPTFMPYVGLGWGHQPVHKGFGFVADIGVAYGRPRVGFQEPSVLTTYIARSAIDQEEADIRSKIERYKWYPIVQIGVSYHF
ncbi:hypothetical protein [Robbsia andropogonis]